MARIACPYCCTIQTFPEGNRCEHCAQEVPEKYLVAARKTPPFYLAVVGMTAHGKTTFLNSLAYAMDNFSEISDGAFLDPLDDRTVDLMRAIRGQIESRSKTESTQPRARGSTLQEPLLFTLKSFMTDGRKSDRHTMVMYDLAGESFRDRAEIQEYAEPLKLCHTVWFVVSLYDLETQGSEFGTIGELFNIYVTGMERIGANPRGRRLHVIYSKADKLVNRLEPDILSYIRDDDYVNLARQSARDLESKQFDETQYVARLEEMSAKLHEFTRQQVKNGKGFINMVKDTGMELTFSMNTAMGSDYARAVRDFQSYRVIDPLVWALRENVAIGPPRAPTVYDQGNEMVLILDTGRTSHEEIYNRKLPSAFFTALSDFGEVTTYHLGRSQPVTQVGLVPSDQPPREEATINLVGPILDRLDRTAKVLLVTCRSIRDLVDFHAPEWHARMAIITFDDRYRVRGNDFYPCSAVFDRASSLSRIEQARLLVNRLLKAVPG